MCRVSATNTQSFAFSSQQSLSDQVRVADNNPKWAREYAGLSNADISPFRHTRRRRQIPLLPFWRRPVSVADAVPLVTGCSFCSVSATASLSREGSWRENKVFWRSSEGDEDENFGEESHRERKQGEETWGPRSEVEASRATRLRHRTSRG